MDMPRSSQSSVRAAAGPENPDRLEAAPGDSAGTPGFLRLLAHSRAALAAYVGMDEALGQGRLTRGQRERIALAVAEINGSVYGLSAHYAAAREAGLSEEEIRLARQSRSHDTQAGAMLRFVQSVTLQRGEISDADFASLAQAGFEAEAILEIVSNIALNIFADYCNNAARTEVDFPLLRPGVEKPGTEGPGALAARGSRFDGGIIKTEKQPNQHES